VRPVAEQTTLPAKRAAGPAPDTLAGDLGSLATLLGLVAATPALPTRGELVRALGGGFEIHELLGVGGMGAVYRATDLRLQRPVALKVPRHVDGPDEEDQVVVEARALARLAHPNVVAVHEVRETPTMTVLVMEYVAGRTLRQWLESERPRPRTIAAQFAEAGAGLAAAHAAGVIHRDFKPDNAIVGDDGRVRVLDFGLAHSDRTGSDSLHGGTPRYRAPEQRNGIADERTDQYAFCMSLAEALAGDRAAAATTQKEMISAASGAPSWLRRIIARGTASTAGDRFESMDALLRTIRANLRSPMRMVIAAGLVIPIAVAASLLYPSADDAAVCSGGPAEIATAWNADRAAKIDAAFGAAGATDTARRVQDGLDDYAGRWVAAHRDACEATSSRKERSAHALDQSMACLSRGRAQLATLVGELAVADPRTIAHSAAAVLELSGPEHCLEARTVVEPPPELVADEVAAINEELGAVRALFTIGRTPDAEATALVDRARATKYDAIVMDALLVSGGIATTLRRDEAAALLDEAFRIAFASGYDEIAAVVLGRLVTIHVLGENMTEALRYFELGQAAAMRAGESTKIRASLACGIAQGLPAVDRCDEALAKADECVALRAEVDGEASHAYAHALGIRAHTLMGCGQYDRTADEAMRALAAMEAAYGGIAPAIPRTQRLLAQVLTRLGDYERAHEYAASALESNRRLFGEDDPRLAGPYMTVANALRHLGRGDEVLVAMERGYALIVAKYGDAHHETGMALGNLAIAYVGLGKLDLAIERAQASLEVLARAHPNGDPTLVNANAVLGTLQRYAGNLDGSLAHLEASVAMAEIQYGPDHAERVNPLVELGHTLEARGEHARAIEVLERAHSRLDNPNVPGPIAAEALFALATSLRSARTDPARARTLAESAKALYESFGASAAQQVQAIDAWLAAQ
jgi:hypothetical protein